MLVVMSACGTTVFSLLPIASGQLLGQENVVTALGLFRTYQAVATFLSIFSAGGFSVQRFPHPLLFTYLLRFARPT